MIEISTYENKEMMIEYRDIQFKDLCKIISSSLKSIVDQTLGELSTYKLEFN